MSQPEIGAAPPQQDSEAAPQPLEMEPRTQDLQLQHQQDPKKLNIQFSIWPPSQRTRDAVINRLIETLSTPSVLSKRYGTVPPDEASSVAGRIEEDAFAAAAAAASAEQDGVEILQLYSKEISKRMLEIVKARAQETPQNPNVTDAASEEKSAVENES